MLALQTITDTRDRRRGREVIDAIVSPRMDSKLRTFLVQDAAGQRAIGLGRHFDTSLEMWFRPGAQGGTDGDPTEIDAEIVGNLAIAADQSLHSWYLQRIDVIWADGR